MDAFTLKRPVLTEKSLLHAQRDGAYTFYVDPSATKNQVKEAVETAYGVHVTTVRTTALAGKRKRTGKRRVIKRTQDRKKAIVVLRKGEKIEAFELQS